MHGHLSSLIYVDANTELTAIQDIPAIQRRRLSPLAKIALHTAKTVLQQHQGEIDYIVWSSCYGDEQTTLSIMQNIAQDELPSPAQFSTSVHNAISGLYSILYQDNTPATSLSSMPHHSWQDALLEAYSYLQIHHKKNALIVYYDAPLPDVYHIVDEHHQNIQTTHIHAISAILSLDKPANLSMQFKGMTQPHYEPQAKAFYDFWYSEQQQWRSQSWIFEKHDSQN